MLMSLSHDRSQITRGAELNIDSRSPWKCALKKAAPLGHGKLASSTFSGMAGRGDHGKGPFCDLGEGGLGRGIKTDFQKIEASRAIGGDAFQHPDPGGIMDGSDHKRSPQGEKVLNAQYLTMFGCHSKDIPVGKKQL